MDQEYPLLSVLKLKMNKITMVKEKFGKLAENLSCLDYTLQKSDQKTLGELDNRLKNWDFDKGKPSEYIEIITKRNLLIYENTPLVNFSSNYNNPPINEAVIDSRKISNLENMALHVGHPRQKELNPLISEYTGSKNNHGVFFSTFLKDVLNFIEFKDKSLPMVYFIDLKSVKEARVQKDYESKTISRYDLEDLYMLASENPSKKGLLQEEHEKLNNEWIKKHTVPFDFSKIKEFKKEENDWLIIKGPVNITY